MCVCMYVCMYVCVFMGSAHVMIDMLQQKEEVRVCSVCVVLVQYFVCLNGCVCVCVYVCVCSWEVHT